VPTATIRAIVHDPDPSLDRQLIEPAPAAVGLRRVRIALPDRLSNGTDAEKAGAEQADGTPAGGTGSSTNADRHPVKSSLGEVVRAADLDHRGLAGDRQWAVRDADGEFGSGKTARRFRRMPGLFQFRAYAAVRVLVGVIVLHRTSSRPPASDTVWPLMWPLAAEAR
jgi:hypothetical protein